MQWKVIQLTLDTYYTFQRIAPWSIILQITEITF